MSRNGLTYGVVVAATLFSACGGSETFPDGRPRPDGAIDATPPPCTVSSTDFGAVTVINPLGLFQDGRTGDIIDDIVSAGGRLEMGLPHDSIVVEMFGGIGAFAGIPITTGTYTIAGDDLQYQTCGICFRVVTDVNADGSRYVDDYLATGGTVTITAVPTAAGQTLTLSASQLTFEHVMINTLSSESTSAGDGCTTAVDSVAFDVTTMGLPARMAPTPRGRGR